MAFDSEWGTTRLSAGANSPLIIYINDLDCGIFPVSEMTYTVSSGTLNPSISYHTIVAFQIGY